MNLTRAMAIDLAPYNIRVNTVIPTLTGTAVGKDSGEEARSYKSVPLGRLGQPHDQAMAVLFMASDDSDFVTGAELRVDGGSLATWGTGAG